jgi:hypothetical protein
MVGLNVFLPSVTRYAYYDDILYDILPCHTKCCPKDACGMQVINLTLLYDGSERLSPLISAVLHSLASVTYFAVPISVDKRASLIGPFIAARF